MTTATPAPPVLTAPFVTVVEDAAGHYLEGKQAVMDVALTAASNSPLEIL